MSTELSVVENNSAVFEAKDYFDIIKSSRIDLTKNDIENTLKILVGEYENATSINQTKMANRLKFYIASTMKHLNLVGTKYSTFVESTMISEYINKVQPRNSVKIVELERYCRIIPKENSQLIQDAIKGDYFDEILILYTDLTGERNETAEEKAIIARNKDPIAFGIHRDKELEISNPKFFVITDWVDEWCDLSFDKLIGECVKYNIKEEHGKLKQNAFSALISKCSSIIDDV